LNSDYIYGLHTIKEAVLANRTIEKVFVQEGKSNPDFNSLIAELKSENVVIQYVPIQKLDYLSWNNPHQGIVALLSAISYVELEVVVNQVIENGLTALFMLLDGVTDVRNLGAIARNAESLGANALFLPTQNSAPITPVTLKASAGALNYIPVCRINNPKSAILLLKEYGIQIVAVSEKAENPLSNTDLSVPTCLILGDEGKGIGHNLLQLCDTKGYIPLFGKITSLNVSVAAGIALYEANQQRNYRL